MTSRCFLSGFIIPILFPFMALAQASAPEPDAASLPSIQDNSFLVEEAYNQEYGVVQHISSFTRLWDSKDWTYSFTQEWPAPGDPRHQLSYTLAFGHAGGFPNSGTGVSDVMLNYRYQLVGSGRTRTAFAPLVSLSLPTGDSSAGRGSGGFGVHTNLPLSVEVTRKFVTHWNAGASFFPNAKNEFGDKAFSSGYSLGQSVVWLAHPRFNVLFETFFDSQQGVVGPNHTNWENSLYFNPGIRWAYNLKNHLQIVPGIAVPIGAGPSQGDKGVFLYLSFEHPFRRLPGE